MHLIPAIQALSLQTSPPFHSPITTQPVSRTGTPPSTSCLSPTSQPKPQSNHCQGWIHIACTGGARVERLAQPRTSQYKLYAQRKQQLEEEVLQAHCTFQPKVCRGDCMYTGARSLQCMHRVLVMHAHKCHTFQPFLQHSCAHGHEAAAASTHRTMHNPQPTR